MTTNIKAIFSEPLGIYQYHNDFTTNEKNIVEKNIFHKSFNNSISTDNQVLENTNLINIKNFINRCLFNYFSTVFNPKNNVEIYITESWLNKSLKGEFHHVHNHANSIVSGVFYFKTVENDLIKLHRNKQNVPFLFIEANKYNNFSCFAWVENVYEKQLVLFPSNLEHEVPPFKKGNERISLAFNTFVKGDINKSFTTSLKI